MDYSEPWERETIGYKKVQQGRKNALTRVNAPVTKKWKKRKVIDKAGFIPNAVRSIIEGAQELTPSALKKLTDKDYVKKHGRVFPGTKYIGPGNPMDLGEPVNDGDALAYEHDLAYDRLIKAGVPPTQVYLGLTQADDDAIEAAKSVLSVHKDKGAAAVLLGLGAKRKGSQLAKMLYDRLPESVQKSLPLSTWKSFYPDPEIN